MTPPPESPHEERARLRRILHLVVVNSFVGGMVGLERTVLPLLAEAEFAVSSHAAAIAFVATFGVSKAGLNLFAGAAADAWGRRRLLIAGWLVGLPVPLILIYAPTWGWVLFANVLLGVNQSLTWSMTVVMKVDLATPRTYGRVIGWNEFAGYAGMAAVAGLTGVVAASFGLRPLPFQLGIALVLLGLALSLATEETRPPMRPDDGSGGRRPSPLAILAGLRRDAAEDARLRVASLAGLATNLKDGVLWGLLPIVLAARGQPLERIGVVVALYPMVWAFSQLLFGPMSDRTGRRALIGAGLLVQCGGVALFAGGDGYPAALAAAVLAGIGTGMVYPTLLAFVSDLAAPSRRASALGLYRFWRDLGYAVGALGAGFVADRSGPAPAIALTSVVVGLGALVFISGTARAARREGSSRGTEG